MKAPMCHARFDTRFFCRWRGRRDMLGEGLRRPSGRNRSIRRLACANADRRAPLGMIALRTWPPLSPALHALRTPNAALPHCRPTLRRMTNALSSATRESDQRPSSNLNRRPSRRSLRDRAPERLSRPGESHRAWRGVPRSRRATITKLRRRRASRALSSD